MKITDGYMFSEECLPTLEWENALKQGGFIATLHKLACEGSDDAVYKFIEEKKITHYVNAIFLGDCTNCEKRRVDAKTTVGFGAKVEAQGGGEAGGKIQTTCDQSARVEVVQKVEDGVVVHSILPIHTLIKDDLVSTRVKTAVKLYIDNKSASKFSLLSLL